MRRAVLPLLLALVAACSTGPPAPPPTPAAAVRVLGGEAPSAPVAPLEGSLPFFYDLYTFRGDSGLTHVVAAFAVPAGRLEERRRRDGSRYIFDVTVVLADTALGIVARTDDSVAVRLNRSAPDTHLLYTQVELEAPAGDRSVYRVIMTDAARPGIGQLYEAAFLIPDFSGDGLMISDIALGQPGVQGGWARGDLALALLPTSLLPQTAFDVYYEIYNLPEGARYTTELSIEAVPHDGASEDVSRIRFAGEAVATDGVVRELRRVETSLPRGRYRLTVTVTDQATDRRARASRLFNVRGWPPGSTLIRALPRAGARSSDRNDRH